jgi:hypothetical protein
MTLGMSGSLANVGIILQHDNELIRHQLRAHSHVRLYQRREARARR